MGDIYTSDPLLELRLLMLLDRREDLFGKVSIAEVRP